LRPAIGKLEAKQGEAIAAQIGANASKPRA
jgi:hypothetical protein